MARPLLLLTLSFALAGCRPSPSDVERRWERKLRESLPPGWKVVALVGDPANDRFVCWLAAPGGDQKEYRVEVRVTPRAPSGRLWAVLVHPPAEPEPQKSVRFHAPDDGSGPLELADAHRGREATAEKARPLAEEAVRQVRGLGLF